MRLIVIELDALEQSILSLKTQDDYLLSELQEDRSINHRQVEVLSKAILVPETVFKISEHQEHYGLAYSTARADLNALVERGYFNMCYESKAQVFRARFDMKQLLSEQYRKRQLHNTCSTT